MDVDSALAELSDKGRDGPKARDLLTVLGLRIRIWCRASGTKAKELVIHPREGIAGDFEYDW